jgi:hypothetical protein
MDASTAAAAAENVCMVGFSWWRLLTMIVTGGEGEGMKWARDGEFVLPKMCNCRIHPFFVFASFPAGGGEKGEFDENSLWLVAVAMDTRVRIMCCCQLPTLGVRTPFIENFYFEKEEHMTFPRTVQK